MCTHMKTSSVHGSPLSRQLKTFSASLTQSVAYLQAIAAILISGRGLMVFQLKFRLIFWLNPPRFQDLIQNQNICLIQIHNTLKLTKEPYNCSSYAVNHINCNERNVDAGTFHIKP
jgi:hypothetical protein